MVSGKEPDRGRGRPALMMVAWLRKAVVAVICAVLGHVPVHVLVALVICLTAALLVVSSKNAQAQVPRLLPDGQLDAAGALGVAVDNSESESDAARGDVYVAGFALVENSEPVVGRVNKFDPSGTLLSPPSPFGVAPSLFESGAAYSGAAVNPVNGDVYTLGMKLNSEFKSEAEIDTYDPATGAPVGAPFPVDASGNFSGFFGIPMTVVGIATDSAGNVYVPVAPKNEVVEYSENEVLNGPSGAPPISTFTGGASAGGFRAPTSVSVDPSGSLWVADAGNDRILELSPADTPIREIASEGVRSVAVDAHGDVFAMVSNSVAPCGKLKPPCPHLVEYDPLGTEVADVGAGVIGTEAAQEATAANIPLPNMVSVSNATGRVYVTEGVIQTHEHLHSRVFKYLPPVAPSLESEVAVEVGVSEAKLGAVVNPGGLGASYRFEYGTTPAYGDTAPFPEGDTGGGFTSRSVWASVVGLLPGTTYHYRVVVHGALGELVGQDQTFTTQTAAQTACPNEQLRTGFSVNLPDCRVYELVTPPNKTSSEPDPPEGGQGGNIEGSLEGNFAAIDGSRFAFVAEDVFPGSKSAGTAYIATRGANGWTTENVTPPTNHYKFISECATPLPAYSVDLSKEILSAESGTACGLEPELVRGEPKSVKNVFLRDNTNGSYQLVDPTPVLGAPADAKSLDVSADFSHVVFNEQAKLTEDAPDGVANLYEWSGGVVRLATVLPDETPVAGSFAGFSQDGTHVFFTYAGNLFARVNGVGTVQVDASQAGGSGGGGGFVAASPAGSRVLFNADASAGLTGDTVPGSGTNLYCYDFSSGRLSHLDASQSGGSGGGGGFISLSADGSKVLFSDEPSAALTGDTMPESGKNLYIYDLSSGRLSDLTPGAHAELQSVTDISEDGSHVYFAAQGALAAGATQGQPNAYLWNAGTTTLIPALGRASKDGRFLAFASTDRLTGYDNTDVGTGSPDAELYLYDAASDSLACASCNPSGAPPIGGPLVSGNHFNSSHYLAEDGRVFFQTSEALLPADTNGQQDVYEFEPDGVGTCSDPGGCVSLISTGTGSQETWFIEASPSGDDVFLREYQKLVPADKQEEARTIYDVRVNGGISEHTSTSECTTEDACRAAPAPQPSIFGAPASQTFSGAGNFLAPAPAVGPLAEPRPKPKKCRKGYVKKKNKCVKRKAKKGTRARKTNRKESK